MVHAVTEEEDYPGIADYPTTEGLECHCNAWLRMARGDSTSILVRQAANIIALYEAMQAVRRNGGLQLARLAQEFVTAVAQARANGPVYRQAQPTRFLGRGLTLLVRSNRGHWEAALTPNHYSRDILESMLDRGDAGRFHRPEDWADTRYFDSFHSAFCKPSEWIRGLAPGTGVAAFAAAAAMDAPRAREGLQQGLGDFDLGMPMVDFLAQVRERASKTTIKHREPATIPIRVLRVARERGVGYGETLAYWLHSDSWGPGLTAKETAYLLGVNTRDQAKKMARDASKKLDGVGTLMRLVPPWPAKEAPEKGAIGGG